MAEKTALRLKKNEEAEVVAIEGGHLVRSRLEGLGIRPGKKVTRVSSQFMGGPVIISIDGRQTAMGRGLAARIRVVAPVQRETR